jgi:L-aminopeptidase/D-esterase-like protein
MYKGCITDIAGIVAGHYTDTEGRTGCTVVIAKEGAVCGADVRGGAPGTRETDLCHTGNLVSKAHAVLLTGGSAYGLDAAGGVMRYLEEHGIGFETQYGIVPIVPAAVIYDLDTGRSDIRPDKDAGYAACMAASGAMLEQGSLGAGTGASVGKLLGPANTMRGGIGAASLTLRDGTTVAALFAVNAFGDVVDPHTGAVAAGLRDENGAHMNTVDILLSGAAYEPNYGQNTTIGIVATDALLTKEEANKMAAIAHDGVALAIRPSHTMLDGDTVFALSTGKKQGDFNLLLTAAVEVTVRAIVNACQKANEV